MKIEDYISELDRKIVPAQAPQVNVVDRVISTITKQDEILPYNDKPLAWIAAASVIVSLPAGIYTFISLNHILDPYQQLLQVVSWITI